jgi:hypothetical protein
MCAGGISAVPSETAVWMCLTSMHTWPGSSRSRAIQQITRATPRVPAQHHLSGPALIQTSWTTPCASLTSKAQGAAAECCVSQVTAVNTPKDIAWTSVFLGPVRQLTTCCEKARLCQCCHKLNEEPKCVLSAAAVYAWRLGPLTQPAWTSQT